MACERFRDALKARAIGAPLAPDAAAHIAVCSACQETLEREERLQAVIASALDDVGSAAPSPDFTARVRIAAERVPQHGAARRWLPAAAVVAALIVAGYAVRQADTRGVHTAGVAAPLPPATTTSEAPVAPAARSVARPAVGARPKRATAARRASASEVLVPRREREAVERLFASLRAGRPEAVSVLEHLNSGGVANGANEVSVPPIRIEPVAVPELRVSPPVVPPASGSR